MPAQHDSLEENRMTKAEQKRAVEKRTHERLAARKEAAKKKKDAGETE
jgi:hypothetical protein